MKKAEAISARQRCEEATPGPWDGFIGCGSNAEIIVTTVPCGGPFEKLRDRKPVIDERPK